MICFQFLCKLNINRWFLQIIINEIVVQTLFLTLSPPKKNEIISISFPDYIDSMKFLVHSTSTASIEDKTADKADKADSDFSNFSKKKKINQIFFFIFGFGSFFPKSLENGQNDVRHVRLYGNNTPAPFPCILLYTLIRTSGV